MRRNRQQPPPISGTFTAVAKNVEKRLPLHAYERFGKVTNVMLSPSALLKIDSAKHMGWWGVTPSPDASVEEFILCEIEGLLSMTSHTRFKFRLPRTVGKRPA